MDPNQKTDNSDYSFELDGDEVIDESGSVDDFLRELEEKEKDLHITSDMTFIEIAADFEDEAEIPDFMRPQDITPAATVKPAASAPAAPSPAGSGEVKKLEAEVASLKAKIIDLEEERTELYKNSQRRLKDFEAFKTRTERERRETFQRQLSNLATQMLPALDNLDRALQCASDLSTEKQGEFAQFFDGIVLVNQQVNEVLVEMGIEPIRTVGCEFDPHLHEAVAIDEGSDQPPNTITAELLRGFRIGDSVIRHSMVKVSTAGPAQKPEPPADEERITLEPVSDHGDESNAAFTEQETGSAVAERKTDGETADADGLDSLIERNGHL